MAEDIGLGDGLDQDETLGFDVEPPSGEDPKPLDAKHTPGEAPQDPVEAKPEEDQKDASGTAEGDEIPSEAKDTGEEKATESAEEIPATDEVVEKGRTGPIEVFGKEYPDIRSAFHALKSQAGQHRSMVEKYQQLEQQFNELRENLDKKNGEVASVTAPAASTAEKSTAKDEPRKFIDAVDWEFVDKLSNDPEYGPAKAVQFAINELEGVFQERLDASVAKGAEDLDTRLQGADELVQAREEAAEADKAFGALQSRRNDDGTPTYPEFGDENGDNGNDEFIVRVLERWKSNPHLKSQGEYGAYLAYLDETRWNQHMATTLPDAKPSDSIEKRLKSQNEQAASSVTVDGGLSTPLPADKARKSFEDKFKASLYDAGEDTKDAEILGF